jgi:hypothetical protein
MMKERQSTRDGLSWIVQKKSESMLPLQSAHYLQAIRCHYDKSVQPCTFQVGDLILCRIQKTDSQHKLLSPWEGPFIVSKVTRPGSFELMIESGDPVKNSWNIDQLWRFYA